MPDVKTSSSSAPPSRRPRLTWKWWLGMLLVLAVNYAVVSFVLPGSSAPRTRRHQD